MCIRDRQRDANRLLGFTAQQTLDYLQSLYEKKLCTCLLYTSRNERMFLLTFLVLNTADNPRQLGNNIFQAGSIAQKYNCCLLYTSRCV